MDIFWIKAIIILVIFGLSLFVAMYSTWAERKVAGYMQDRPGPNRAGWGGLLQPLADAGKMFFKEDFIPAQANKWLFIAGPCLAMLTALLSSAVIPFGDTLRIDGQEIQVQGIEVNIGILWVFGIVSLGVYGVMVGGWASNNKFSLLGAIRAASQNISYELALGLSLIAVIMMTGSLSVRDIVNTQHGGGWNILFQPLGFVIFLTCAFAECNRTPFDLPECEAELIGGYHTEYSSMKLGFYLFAEYVNMFVSSCVVSALYFGGFNYPFMDKVAEALGNDATGHNIATAIGFFAFIAKALFFVFFFMWVRWTLPRFRYDQLMNLGWKSLIPLSILNIIVTGIGLMFNLRWFSWVAVVIIVAVVAVQAAMKPKAARGILEAAPVR
ncbi:NADH-quinone oxidoreductase subunit H [Siphonobacter sp. BAB-5385]|uniref:NADH-quinone oxidoreductase subunit NuoH n=1 Tax=unclassified Siphonobacter TaxID=2635712 RepID=UPI000B9DE503|nr:MULTISPECIES: NADH-quinone oxidoreductase subunit NuoH [unclassified Siphonobacter]OZI08631.1 NADH-quinone oxidoreductase subunit H [Siphonobacter sp. BAB-5385]PMD97108.1 NADH-quinone oxidoreductase subunit H [Siphonobacter sp. BAB-5405]